MATPLTPPPGLNDSSGAPPAAPPTAPGAGVSPPAQPAADSSTKDILQAVQLLRGVAKTNPKAAVFITKINDQIPGLMAALMESQTPGEPMAPPNAG